MLNVYLLYLIYIDSIVYNSCINKDQIKQKEISLVFLD